jgi:sigma-B regulation protein RsbQ
VTADVLTRNNVRVLGTGARALVFAQGFGFDLHTWRHVAPAFADDYRIVLFDYVGAGGSDLAAYDASRYRTLDGYASDLLDVCAALDLESVTVVGHSVSAMIAVLASVREPARFHRLVLVCPSPCYRNDPPHYHGGFEREQLDELLELMDHDRDGFARYLAPVVAQNPERPELAEEIRTNFSVADPWILRRFAEPTFLSDNRPEIARVTVPTLILQSAADPIAPPEVGVYLHQHLAGSTLHVLRTTGHAPHLSDPAELVAAIRQYLRAS